MKNGKSRTRFAFIKILDQHGEVMERFAIDSKGKPVLQSKKEDQKEVVKPKPLPKPQVEKPAPQPEVEPVLGFEPESFVHLSHIDDEFIFKDLEQIQGDLNFDFDADIALNSAIELLPDPFFL